MEKLGENSERSLATGNCIAKLHAKVRLLDSRLPESPLLPTPPARFQPEHSRLFLYVDENIPLSCRVRDSSRAK